MVEVEALYCLYTDGEGFHSQGDLDCLAHPVDVHSSVLWHTVLVEFVEQTSIPEPDLRFQQLG